MQQNKYKKIKQGIQGFLVLLVVFSWSSVQAESTPETGVQISPIRFDLQMKEGEQKNEEIVVHNFSDVPHDVEVQVEDFFVSNDSQQANFFVPDKNHPLKAYDVIDWIDVPEDFTLAPGETKRLTIVVNVPKNQPTNGYYGSIFFKTKANNVAENDNIDGVKLDVNYRVGVLMTIAVQGDEKMKIDGSVEDFGVSKKIFWESPIIIFAKLKSDGNVHYKAGGKVEIRKFGKRFAVIKIDNRIMYPGRERTFREQVIFDMWDYGIYSAKLDMQSEDGSVPFKNKEITFFVIPWKTTVIIIGIIFLIFISWKMFNKKFAIIKRQEIK